MLTRAEIESRIRAFAQAFDDNDLSVVMESFAVGAVYRTVHGNLKEGKEDIRKELEPQFQGAYGKMYFEVTGITIDEVSARVTLSWTCHHDMDQRARGIKNELTRKLYQTIGGRKFHWSGADDFELDPNSGLIKAKRTFATTKLPRLFKVA